MAASRECTQCGACFDTCPVSTLRRAEEFSPKAKQQIIRKGWADDGELDWQRMMTLAGQCVSCGRCRQACARRLSVPEVLGQARARHPRWQQYVWREWIGRGAVLWSVAARMAPWIPEAVLPARANVLRAAALAMKAPGEPPAWLRLRPDTPLTAKGGRFLVFSGCTAARLRPAWTLRAEATIRRLGGTVLPAAGFGCCGGTYAHAGLPGSAREAAEANVARWKALGMPRLALFCASCLHGLRGYAEMEGLMDEAETRAWLEALTPLSGLLENAGVETTPNAPSNCAYHSPCHWDGRDEDGRWLAAALPGLRQGSALCCGFGGVLQLLEPELSRELAEACWRGLEGEGAAGLPTLTGCSGCVMQLNAHAPQGAAALHWLDIWRAE